MAFRKRVVPVSSQHGPGGLRGEASPPAAESGPSGLVLPGTRPSSLTGQSTTSTGTNSLDGYLGGHGGLVTGSSLLIEEPGSTDFSGALLKLFAAEGIVQGHHLHVVAVDKAWIRELPGLVEGSAAGSSKGGGLAQQQERMKIAWRYERLGQVDAARVGTFRNKQGSADSSQSMDPSEAALFGHTFDFAKKLILPATAVTHHHPVTPLTPPTINPFIDVMARISKAISNAPGNVFHRIVIPAILSPAFYPPHAANPENFLQFLHSLRACLSQNVGRVVAMITLPTELYSRDSGLIRWAEHICAGVIELRPFPRMSDDANSLAESGGARDGEEKPQGMFKIEKLPGLTERGANGGGDAAVGIDLTFTLSRRRFLVRPFSLPPLDGEPGSNNDIKGSDEPAALPKAQIEF